MNSHDSKIKETESVKDRNRLFSTISRVPMIYMHAKFTGWGKWLDRIENDEEKKTNHTLIHNDISFVSESFFLLSSANDKCIPRWYIIHEYLISKHIYSDRYLFGAQFAFNVNDMIFILKRLVYGICIELLPFLYSLQIHIHGYHI